MRNRVLHASVALAASSLLIAGCDLRPLYIEGETPVEVLVLADWTQLGGTPEGASIYFYPESGDVPRVFKTNSVKRTSVKVPSGYYNVIVFNRTVDEFGTMKFNDMDHLAGARAILEDKLFSWVGRADTVGRTVYEPEEIVVGRVDHFYVRTMSERNTPHTKAEPAAVIDSVKVTPRRMIYTGNVNVRVQGIYNVRSVRAYITGMAGESYLATRSAGDTLATHVLESWRLDRDAGDYTKGYLRSSFGCLGLPEQYIGSREAKNNRLVLQLRLVDDKTEMEFIFNVGEKIQQIDKELTVDVTVETDDDGKPIVVPDVKPTGGSESGFDVSFTDWDDPIDIPVGI